MDAVYNAKVHDLGHSSGSSKYLAGSIVSGTIGGICGYLGARLVTGINPIGGAIFGAAASISAPIHGYILNKLFGDSTVEKIAKMIVDFFLSIGAGMLGASLAGFSFTFPVAVAFECATLAVYALVVSTLYPCLPEPLRL